MTSGQNTQIQPPPVFLEKLCQEKNEGARDHGISLLDQAPVGYCILNEKGMFLEINATALTLLKTTKNQLTQKSISRFIFPEDQDRYYHHRRKLLETSKPQTYELRLVATDGTTFWTMFAVTIILEADSALRYHLVITDISEHKKMQEAQAKRALDSRVKKSEKAHSVTRLAGGVAHSFNNMLGVISGYTEMALQQVAEDQPLHADLFIIKMAADRCAELTRQLLAFAGRQRVTPQIVDLNPAIDKQVRSLRQTLPAGIRLHWQPGDKLWPVKVDPSQFEQILNHLCANAAEAITASGAITLQTQNRRVDEAVTSGHRWLVSGEYVQLTVHDDGCGIATQNLDHVFKPFFTTKINEQHYLPPYFRKREEYNRQGPPPLDFLPQPVPMTATAVHKAQQEGALLLDLRSPEAFAGAFVPGSLAVPLAMVPAYGGYLLDYDADIIFIVESEHQIASAVQHLIRMGYDRVVGYLQGGLHSWEIAGEPYDRIGAVHAADLGKRLKAGEDFTLLNVHKIPEYQESRLNGATHISLGELPDRVDEIDRGKPIVTFCGSGVRAIIAASILKRHGFKEVEDCLGSMQACAIVGCEMIKR